MLSDLYANEVGHNDNSYASDTNWNKKDRPEQDMKLIVGTNIDEDELEDIDDLGDEDDLHFGNGIADDEGIADNKNQQDHFGPAQHENQHNYFGPNQNDVEECTIVDVADEDIDKDNKDDNGDNNHLIPDDFSSSWSGLHSKGNNDTDDGNDNYYANDNESDDDSDALDTPSRLSRIVKA